MGETRSVSSREIARRYYLVGKNKNKANETPAYKFYICIMEKSLNKSNFQSKNLPVVTLPTKFNSNMVI